MAPAVIAATNPVKSADDWQRMREACLDDPGAFHGNIASKTIHWFVPHVGTDGAWIMRGGDRAWTGFDAATGVAVSPILPEEFTPWSRAFDADDAPHWRWFTGAKTNAAFNEVDRHVLGGHGAEAAFIFEGDRWDMSSNGGQGAPVDCFAISRKQLLLETAKCAVALTQLGLKAGDRIALNMPSIMAQIYWTDRPPLSGPC